MRRLLYVGLGIVALLIISQLLVPPYLEHRAEKRLTEKGGHADVHIEALPAFRLLFDDGQRIKVRGDGLHVEILNGPNSRRVFDELDRFEEADVRFVRMSAGPFAVSSVRITRPSSDEP
jgi:hypothetical protein